MRHKPTFKRLWIEEDKILPEVMKIMANEYNFKPSYVYVRYVKETFSLSQPD